PTRPDIMPKLKNGRGGGPRRRAQHVLVVAQIAMSFLILVAAGLFARTLNKLHSVQLGYGREHILLFSLNGTRPGIATRRSPLFTRTCASLRSDPRSEQRDAFALLDHQRRPCPGRHTGDNEDRRCYHPKRKRPGRRTAFPHDDADSDPGRARE